MPKRFKSLGIKFDDCPICGKEFNPKRPAISRKDNKTKICSACGIREALVGYKLSREEVTIRKADIQQLVDEIDDLKDGLEAVKAEVKKISETIEAFKRALRIS